MEKTAFCLLRAYKLYERAAHRKVRSSIAQANQGGRHANRAAVATAVCNTLKQCLPLLVYMGWLVRGCSWASPRTPNGTLGAPKRVRAERMRYPSMAERAWGGVPTFPGPWPLGFKEEACPGAVGPWLLQWPLGRLLPGALVRGFAIRLTVSLAAPSREFLAGWLAPG